MNSRGDYYDNLQMGLPANYYDDRHDPDHTKWVEYFTSTLAEASNQIRTEAERLYRLNPPGNAPWTSLTRRQQQLLVRMTARSVDQQTSKVSVAPVEIMEWFDISKPTAHEWLKEWVSGGLMEPVDPGERIRYHRLTREWQALVDTVRQIPTV